uniref:UBC core domain-containing protein n=1 Tax=Anopheles maculatus TaxID=74869 RepID=A0A182S5Z5_9DIPT
MTPAENMIITQQNLALDILIWIVTIRMMRYRYPKNPFAKRAAPTEVRNVASTDLNVQQTECVQIIEKHLEQTIRHCLVLANRSIAHKGAQNMVDKNVCSAFELSLNEAITKCLPDIVNSNHAGALRWFALLISGTTMAEHHLSVADHCMRMLKSVAEEMRKRNNPYAALLRTRFGLHGSPFDSEVFEAPSMDGRVAFGGGASGYPFGCGTATNGLNMNGGGGSSGNGCCNNSSKGGGNNANGPPIGSSVLTGPSPIDLRLMCFADGADLKCLFEQLRSRSIGSHFMGLLEVEPLHYSCCATSDATRLENIDANGNATTTTAASSSTVNGFGGPGASGMGNGITIEPVSGANMLMDNMGGVDVKVDIPNDTQGEHSDTMIVSYLASGSQQTSNSGSQGKIATGASSSSSSSVGPSNKKSTGQPSSGLDKENIGDALMNNVKNVLVDKIFFKALQQHKLKSAGNAGTADTIGFPTYLQQTHADSHNNKPNAINIGSEEEIVKLDPLSIVDEVANWVTYPIAPWLKCTTPDFERASKAVSFVSNDAANLDLQQGSHTSLLNNKIQEYLDEKSTTGAETGNDQQQPTGEGLPWHKLLASPPKHTIVVERMHSSAIRYVTLDFGAPIMLTDVIIPAHSDLASLSIDVWCFEEEADSVRLVVSQDIHSRTLVLSDLQPPPICRYLKITITGRYGMTATRCRIPMGSFFGHIVILDREAYADPVMKFLHKSKPNVQTQLKVLKALYEDVHCRYCLASSKLMDLLVPYLNSDASNIAHMQAFLNRMKDTSFGGALGADMYGTYGTYGSSVGGGSSASVECAKVTAAYEECIGFQHQLNVIRRVIDRIRPSIEANHPLLVQLMLPTQPSPLKNGCSDLSSIYTDKLRVMSECLIEVILQLITMYGGSSMSALGVGIDQPNLDQQQQQQQQQQMDQEMCNLLFDTMVIAGDAHTQLATCSMLVRLCCFESWWGDFLADKFLTLYSSQNDRIFPQDR